MPGGDRTGPEGRGQMTGRGLGFCSGNDRPGYQNPGFGRGRGFRWRQSQSDDDSLSLKDAISDIKKRLKDLETNFGKNQ